MRAFIQRPARQDILSQYAYYLAQDQPRIANRFLRAVNEAVAAVLKRPNAGAPKRFDNPELSEVRTWPVKGFDEFRIYYVVRGTDCCPRAARESRH